MFSADARRLIAISLVLSTALSASAALAVTGPGKGNVANGKVLFTKKVCAQCHKPDGSGGIKLTGNPTPNWRDKKRMATVTDDFIRDCITNGKIKSGMVAWGKTGQLKPSEIEDLIVYIRTFSK